MLPDTCHTARIRDIYPGGNIVYFVDPPAAQVFVEDVRRPGTETCLDMLVPWFGSTSIPDKAHNKVEIYVNQIRALVVDVREESQDLAGGTGQFIVIALTGADSDRRVGCQVLTEGSLYPAIYSQVYGPAARQACDEWVTANCGGQAAGGPSELMEVAPAGGASQLPLARSTRVAAVSHNGDLILHVPA